MHRCRRQLHLRLHPRCPHDLETRRRPGQVVQQSCLPDPGLPTQNKRPALSDTNRSDHPIQRGALSASPPQAPGPERKRVPGRHPMRITRLRASGCTNRSANVDPASSHGPRGPGSDVTVHVQSRSRLPPTTATHAYSRFRGPPATASSVKGDRGRTALRLRALLPGRSWSVAPVAQMISDLRLRAVRSPPALRATHGESGSPACRTPYADAIQRSAG
jgi:hypothetical protein